MKFGKAQTSKFGALAGSFSVVTPREFDDSQITLTDFETELLVSHFGRENLQLGNVTSNPERAAKPFRLYPDGKVIFLNVVYPKPEKSELRLYLSEKSGFKPQGDDVWFLFVKDGDLWIGAQTETEWRRQSSKLKEDQSDGIYQEGINETDEIRIGKLKERDQFLRDKKIAVARMEIAKYVCEYDSEHILFNSKSTGKPYLEAHHLIPIGLQSQFEKKLDTLTNVYCLCAYCHRAVHYAEERLAKEILQALCLRRPVLDEFSLEMTDLLSMYAVEVIEAKSG